MTGTQHPEQISMVPEYCPLLDVLDIQIEPGGTAICGLCRAHISRYTQGALRFIQQRGCHKLTPPVDKTPDL